MKRISVPEEGIETLFGSYDENLKHLEALFNVRIRTQGHDLLVEGESPNVDKVDKLMEKNIIEIAPLAFMRGRTLNDSFIILDEAQNTTPEQMKMFLTRLGFSSKAVVTGDVTQVDLPEGKKSGLREARNILMGVEGIKFFEFGDRDVVRHPLVAKIVVAYDRAEREQQKQ